MPSPIAFSDQATSNASMPIPERVLRPGDMGYENARTVWNGRIDRRPALILKAVNVQDVVWAVNEACRQGLPLAVRGAGHHIHGHGVCDAGIVIDLSEMKGITVDPETRTAHAQPGLTVGEYMQAIQARGLIMTVGSHADVGLAGLTLGGGIGLLMGRYGLVCDHLLSAEVVTAAGSVVTASETEPPDLFWALRGGGGNFGIVKSFTFRLHPADPILAGPIIHPLPRAAEVMRFYRDFTANCPEDLTIGVVHTTGPHEMPICMLMPVYTGPQDAGERLLAPLKAFGPPVMEMVHSMPYTGVLGLLEGRDPAGHHYAFTSRGLPELTDQVIEIISEYAATMTSPGTSIVLYHQHGAVCQLPVEATAYAARFVPYLLGIYVGWKAGDPAPHEDWLRRFRTALEPHSIGTCCINLVGEDGSDVVRDVYGPNYARLTQIKRVWDPDNLFCNNHNIPSDESE